MIPLRLARTSDAPKRPAWVTRSLVLVLLVVFGVQVANTAVSEALIRVFGFVPARLVDPGLFGYTYVEAGLTLLTSLFLHGGFVHLTGNLVYLWVFGSAVEEKIGRWRFAFLYLGGGIAGSLIHAAVFPQSAIPSIGASGCIAGTLGAFLILRSHERIVTLIPLVVSWILIEIPGLVMLPIWFALQFFNGWLALRSASATEQVAGVAWWAHIGGFAMGAVAGGVIRWGTKVKR